MNPEDILASANRARAERQVLIGLARRILVVDDDSTSRRISMELLGKFGYEADGAANGAAGWDAMQAKPYDLVITDNFMPKVTGVELAGRLRGLYPTLPIIMVTGAIPTAELNRHPGLEITAFLLKPYSAREMLQTVSRVLRKTDGAAGKPGLVVDARSLKDRVDEALRSDDYKYPDVKVTTFNGIVRLSGFVNDAGRRDRAVWIARGVAGLKDLDDRITITDWQENDSTRPKPRLGKTPHSSLKTFHLK